MRLASMSCRSDFSVTDHLLSNVYHLLSFSLAEHELLALAHDRVLAQLADSHGVCRLWSSGGSEAGVVITVDASGQAGHAAKGSLGSAHIPISKVL